jgi:hypothetical protein
MRSTTDTSLQRFAVGVRSCGYWHSRGEDCCRLATVDGQDECRLSTVPILEVLDWTGFSVGYGACRDDGRPQVELDNY